MIVCSGQNCPLRSDCKHFVNTVPTGYQQKNGFEMNGIPDGVVFRGCIQYKRVGE